MQAKPIQVLETDLSMRDCGDDTILDEHRTTEQSYDSQTEAKESIPSTVLAFSTAQLTTISVSPMEMLHASRLAYNATAHLPRKSNTP